MFNSNMNNRHAKNSREIKIVQIAWVASRVLYTECPKINRKSVLHLLKYRFAVYVLQMQYRVAVNFGTLSTFKRQRKKIGFQTVLQIAMIIKFRIRHVKKSGSESDLKIRFRLLFSSVAETNPNY